MGKALIIGGTGFIGMEMGEAFVTRGIDTGIINRGDLPAPRWAPELSQALLGEIARRGVIFTPATELHSTLQRRLGYDPHRRPDVLEKTIRRKHNVYRSYRMERLRRSFFFAMIALDMVVGHKKGKEIDIKDSLKWTGFWISIAIAFGMGIYFFKGQTKALDFLTGYLLEYSLSVDNLFVFLMIFTYFSVPPAYQHTALFWGIMGALVMRGIFIVAGVVLVTKFHWLIYVFGIFLVYTAIKMAKGHDEEIHPEKNPILRLLHKMMPVTTDYGSGNFFLHIDGIRHATPLFAVILVLGPTDLMFALDSIPAILAVTTDPFIVYTSNVFALMGLRSLFFALAGLMSIFHYIRHGLVVILMFVGVKMLLTDLLHIPIGWSLGFIAGTLAIAVIASIRRSRKMEMVVNGEDGKKNP